MTHASSSYLSGIETWKAERLAKLTAPTGWLNLTDRLWLDRETSTFGSAEDNDLVLSTGPAHAGTLIQTPHGNVVFVDGRGEKTVLLERHEVVCPLFSADNLLMEITMTNGRNALRVRDTLSPNPGNFPGLDYFDTDPRWRFVANWVALPEPVSMTVDTSRSIPSDIVATHKAVFSLDGQTYELIATHGTPARPQFVFRDATSKDLTYPAARFLFGEDVKADTIVLDFNKAYNPPCSFTEHAVCPLPPRENILPLSITAGEKKPTHVAE